MIRGINTLRRVGDNQMTRQTEAIQGCEKAIGEDEVADGLIEERNLPYSYRE